MDQVVGIIRQGPILFLWKGVWVVYVPGLATKKLVPGRHPIMDNQGKTTETPEKDHLMVCRCPQTCSSRLTLYLIDREKDTLETSSQGPEQSTSKRLKLNRNRYIGESANMAKKTLPINPQAGDRLQGRKD